MTLFEKLVFFFLHFVSRLICMGIGVIFGKFGGLDSLNTLFNQYLRQFA
jgi:hypothetical protein